jgi:hypothetical protein
VTITLPEIGGRYMSMHVVNQDHCAFVESKPGAHELTEDEIGTRFAQVMVRTFYDAGDPDQIAEAHAARARIKISGGGDGPFEAPHWDPDDIAKARGTLSDLATLGFDSTYAFRREEDVRPIDHLVGAAAGGGLPRTAASDAPVGLARSDPRGRAGTSCRDEGVFSKSVRLADAPERKPDGFRTVSCRSAHAVSRSG